MVCTATMVLKYLWYFHLAKNVVYILQYLENGTNFEAYEREGSTHFFKAKVLIHYA